MSPQLRSLFVRNISRLNYLRSLPYYLLLVLFSLFHNNLLTYRNHEKQMFVVLSGELVATSVEFLFQGSVDLCKDVYFANKHVPHTTETPEVI